MAILATNPLTVPQPAGSNGALGIYGGVPYYHNGILYQPLDRDQVFRPPVLTNLVTRYDLDDVDADDSFNANYADLDFLAPIKNKVNNPGTTTSNAVQVSGGAAFTNPKLEKYGCNGRALARFDGNNDRLTINNSSAGWGNITSKGAFDLFFVARLDLSITAVNFFGNATSSTDEGFEIGIDVSTQNQIVILVTTSAGTLKFWQPSISVVPGKVHIINWHSDGTSYFLSVDGGTEATVGTLGTAGSGTMTRDVRMGGTFVTGGADGQYMVGALGNVLFYSSELNSTQRRSTITELKRWYSFA